MKVIQEILKINYDIDLDNFLPGFDHKFGDKINVFKITFNNDFVIDLLEPFTDDDNLKNEIQKFIASEWIEFKVKFVYSQLPF